MKKVITPLFYSVFLFLLTGLSVGVEMLVRSTGLIGEYQNVVDTPLVATYLASLLALGIPLFWLANHLMQLIEKPKSRRAIDHLRQSIFYYAVVIATLATWATRGYNGGESDGYLLLWLGISFLAVITNYLSLRSKHRA